MHESRVGSRHASVDRELHQNLFKFIARKAALDQPGADV